MPPQANQVGSRITVQSSGWWLILLVVAVWIAGWQSRRLLSSGAKVPEVTYSVDINQATELDLLNLPDVGPSLVRTILQYREEHGAFESLEDFQRLPGVGPQTLQRLAPYLKFPEASLSDESMLTARSRERTVP